jgi:MerR family transcriptional regulator, copper efflux regulator
MPETAPEPEPNPEGPPPIACSLSPAAVAERVGRWQQLLAHATDRRAVDGGLAIHFPPGAKLTGRVVKLAAAEEACCPFYEFTIRLTPAGVVLEVRAPAEASELVTAVFGSAG